MAAMDWTTIRDAVTARLAAATSPTDAEIGKTILDALNRLGGQYDEFYTPAADVARSAFDSANGGKFAAWMTTVTAAHVAADRAARFAEGKQATRQSGALDPNRSGETVLAPNAAIPFSLTTPAVSASAILQGSSGPALRLETKLVGSFGNSLAVSVVDSSLGSAFYTLEVQLAPYVERFINVQAGAAPMVASSKLLASAAAFPGAGRPANISTGFSGGEGASLEAVIARLDAAAKLPDLTEAERFLVSEHRRIVAVVYGAKPVSSPFSFDPRQAIHQTTGYGGLGALEDALAVQVARGQTWLSEVG